MKINAPSNKGLLASVIFIFSPLLFVLYFGLASLAKIDIATNPPFLWLVVVTVIGVILLWAAGIVKCVSEIGRYYSSTAQVGLFIFLVTPFIWGAISLIVMVSQFASFAEKLAPYLN